MSGLRSARPLDRMHGRISECRLGISRRIVLDASVVTNLLAAGIIPPSGAALYSVRRFVVAARAT